MRPYQLAGLGKEKNPGEDPPSLILAVWFCDITTLSKKNFISKHHLNSHGYYWPDHSNLNLLFQTRLKAMLGPWSGQIKTHHPPSPPVGFNNCLHLCVEETERQSDHNPVAKEGGSKYFDKKIWTKIKIWTWKTWEKNQRKSQRDIYNKFLANVNLDMMAASIALKTAMANGTWSQFFSLGKKKCHGFNYLVMSID